MILLHVDVAAPSLRLMNLGAWKPASFVDQFYKKGGLEKPQPIKTGAFQFPLSPIPGHSGRGILEDFWHLGIYSDFCYLSHIETEIAECPFAGMALSAHSIDGKGQVVRLRDQGFHLRRVSVKLTPIPS